MQRTGFAAPASKEKIAPKTLGAPNNTKPASAPAATAPVVVAAPAKPAAPVVPGKPVSSAQGAANTAAGNAMSAKPNVAGLHPSKEKLAALKAANRDMGVVVKGADETEYQIMVGVLDTLRQLDITKMGMATD